MRYPLFLLVGCLVTAVVDRPVLADVAGLRAEQSGNPALLYQWSFEGDASQRLLDTAGSPDVRDLTAIEGLNGGDAANILFVPGLDGSTTAMSPERINETAGAALRAEDDTTTSADNLFLPQTMTVELLFRADTTSLTCDGSDDCIAYGVDTRIWPRRRGYYLAQDSRPGSNGDIVAIIGGSFTGGTRVIIDGASLNPGNWYYYAITLEATDPSVDVIPDDVFPQDSDGSDTIVNAYYADVTGGDTTLTQVLTDEMVTGGFSGPTNSVSSGNIGLGMFEDTNDKKQFWDGAIDEVAFYDEVLSGSTLQSHLDTLLASAGTPGDFDGDLDVDVADLALWQRGGSPDPFSASDLGDWQTNFTGSAASASVAIPEPSPLVFLLTTTLLGRVRTRSELGR